MKPVHSVTLMICIPSYVLHAWLRLCSIMFILCILSLYTFICAHIQRFWRLLVPFSFKCFWAWVLLFRVKVHIYKSQVDQTVFQTALPVYEGQGSFQRGVIPWMAFWPINSSKGKYLCVCKSLQWSHVELQYSLYR